MKTIIPKSADSQNSSKTLHVEEKTEEKHLEKTLEKSNENSPENKPADLLEKKEISKNEDTLPKTIEKPTLEDAYIFIQCEDSAYLIEKSLGQGEKMLVF